MILCWGATFLLAPPLIAWLDRSGAAARRPEPAWRLMDRRFCLRHPASDGDPRPPRWRPSLAVLGAQERRAGLASSTTSRGCAGPTHVAGRGLLGQGRWTTARAVPDAAGRPHEPARRSIRRGQAAEAASAGLPFPTSSIRCFDRRRRTARPRAQDRGASGKSEADPRRACAPA